MANEARYNSYVRAFVTKYSSLESLTKENFAVAMDLFRTSEKVYFETLKEYQNDPEVLNAMQSVRYNTQMTALRVNDTID